MDDAFWQWAKTPREQGGAGLQSGQRIADATLIALQREYAKQSQKWELRQDAQGNMVRANPQTGLVLAMTNEQGQPVKGANANPFADYAGPAAGGVAGAAVDTNSMAFQGVQPTVVPAAAPQGNAVAPVNVNPAMPAAAPAPAPAAVAAAASKVYKSEDEVIADARMGYLSKQQAQAILVNQFGLDP